MYNMNFSYNKKDLSKILTFSIIGACLLSCQAVLAYNDRIAVEPNFIFVKYEHELKGESTGFHQALDISLFKNIKPSDCSQKDEFCLQWAEFGKLQIKKVNDKCERYEWTTKYEKPLRVRFDTSQVYLYGGPEQDLQSWPVDYNQFRKYSYVSKEKDSQAVLEPFWIVSNGMYLYVDQNVPLFISQDKGNGYFDLIASREAPYIRKSGITELKYTICKLNDMKEAFKHAIDNVLGKPTGIPDERMVKYPIWSTWAKYKALINSTIVMEYANLIAQSQLPNSQIEIDDKWETCYGSLTVDTKAFPDMKKLVQDLKKMNYRVTVWAHPFVNIDCEPYHSEGVKKGYFVKDQKGSVATTWWNSEKGEGSYIDFTNPEAVSWWQSRLRKVMEETGIDGYKFDAGESSWSPQLPVFHEMTDDYPENILTTYVKACADFGSMVEVRSARGTQKYPIYIRMIDRESSWSGRLALSTLIPTLLQMNILGYPFILPDMVGGNGYNNMKVSDEMFVRWLQANVFMPSIQFSYPPEEYGNDVVRLTKKFIDLHVKYADKIIEAMKNSVKYGTPTNPPVWWVDPTDPVTYHIDSEFLLGEDILVAPVIEEGARSRDIYLPKGYWKDEVKKDAEIIKGPVWLYNYPADLEVLPYFTKVAAPEKKDDKKNNAGVLTPSLMSISLIAVLVGFYNLWF